MPSVTPNEEKREWEAALARIEIRYHCAAGELNLICEYYPPLYLLSYARTISHNLQLPDPMYLEYMVSRWLSKPNLEPALYFPI